MKTRLLVITFILLSASAIFTDQSFASYNAGELQDVLDNCSCQASGQSCIEPELRWWNATHFIDNIECKFLDRVDESPPYGQPINTEKSDVADSYELDEVLCLGHRGVILNDKCQKIGKYDTQTGIPIVNDKTECDKLDGTWHDDRKLCDSKYAPVEYRFQFGHATDESFEDEVIEIKLGQEIQVNDLSLNFHDIEDSRCPSDLTCIWEGNVTAMIAIKNQTHRVSGIFTPGYTLSYITPYEITLVDLQPYPISTKETKYVATVNVSQPEKNMEESNTDFRDRFGEITCKGHTSGGGFLEYPECGPVDQFVTHVLIIVLPIAGITIVAIIVLRKKR